MADVDEADRAFAYWQEWLAQHRGKLDALRATMTGFETAATAITKVETDEEVSSRFSAFRRAHDAVVRSAASLDVTAWLPEDYKPPHRRRSGQPGAAPEDRPSPDADLYYFTAWRGENAYAISDARIAATQIRDALNALKRVTSRSLQPRSREFARAVEDFKFHLGRINTTGWNEAPDSWRA